MNTTKRLPVFEKFIQDVRAAWAELQDTEARMKRVKVLLEGLVKDPTIQEHSKNWPSTEGHKNLLLYEDSDYQFVVNAVVRTPGRYGRIHDHVSLKEIPARSISCHPLPFTPRKAGQRGPWP